METIYFDTPFVISPVCNDQFHQAWFTEKKEIGKVSDVHSLSSDELQSLIVSCLQNRDWCKNLALVSKSYQCDGAKLAADRIRQLC